MYALEIGVVDFDARGAEVGDIEHFDHFATDFDFAGGHAFVDGAVVILVAIINLQDGVSDIHTRVPAGDGAVFRGKEENSLFAGRDLKVSGAAIEDNAGGRGLRAGSDAWGWNHNKVVEWAVDPVTVGIGMRIREGVRSNCGWGSSGLCVGRRRHDGVQSRSTGVVIADPPRASRGAGESPGIEQIGVVHWRLTD